MRHPPGDGQPTGADVGVAAGRTLRYPIARRKRTAARRALLPGARPLTTAVRVTAVAPTLRPTSCDRPCRALDEETKDRSKLPRRGSHLLALAHRRHLLG